jgi:amidophosphoribosyltransferase
MAYNLGVPSFEGLIRNRYSGRTFIESSQVTRAEKARAKYTPLREILEGKKVILVEDSIVRSTTMKALLERIRVEGGAKEIHVRVACPPIIAPCFYGIDMSSVQQLFAPKFLGDSIELTPEIQLRMANELHADSLRYLPVEAIARSIGFPVSDLCQACITGKYPTAAGERLYQLDLASSRSGCSGDFDGRAYELADDTGVRS